jgi:hypothetical protein
MNMLIEIHNTFTPGYVIKTPASVVKDSEEYMQSNNIVGNFLAENCEIVNLENGQPDHENIVSAGELFNHFKRSSVYNGIQQTAFKQGMDNNGYKSEKCTTRGPHHTRMVYHGIKTTRSMFEDDDKDVPGLDYNQLYKKFIIYITIYSYFL